MTTEPSTTEWRRAKAAFERLRDRSPTERERWLAERASREPVLADEVRALLHADATASEVLDVDAPTLHAQDLLTEELDALLGREVGGYRLLEVVGEGGTARVFRAVSMADDQRRAAVKILKPGLNTRAIVARFRQERATLAGLDHPGLIGVIDAGELAEGRPFLITDFVDGAPIDAFCAEQRLDRRARLTLFLEVCDAVHHAHRHLVVHRDLKPSNILVTAEGRPKVLDFGIAKLLDPGLDPAWTDVYGRSPLTPSFASPEQIRGEPVTTASDVYSLGVLLYLLVVGRSPYRPPTTDRAALERAVLEQPPLPPDADVPRDVATILDCALRKSAEERYPSAEHLADDVRRALEHRPLRARRESPWRLLCKLVRRQPFVAAATVGVVCLVLGNWFGALRNLQTVRASESVAWRAHANAVRATDLLAGLLERIGSDPTRAVDLAPLLADAERHLADLGGAPEAEARLRIALGGVWLRLGQGTSAEAHLRRALALTHDTRGLSWRDTDRCLELLVDLAVARGDDAAAAAAQRERTETAAKRR